MSQNNENCNNGNISDSTKIPVGWVFGLIGYITTVAIFFFTVNHNATKNHEAEINALEQRIKDENEKEFLKVENEFTKKLDKEMFDISIQIKKERITNLENLTNLKLEVIQNKQGEILDKLNKE